MPDLKRLRQGLAQLKRYPSEQYWRLFVDGEIATKEGGVAAFHNREPGCLEAMMQGFSQAIAHLQDDTLSVDLISEIAKTCTQQVINFKRSNVSQGKSREGIIKSAFFRLNKDKVSTAGLTQFIEQYEYALATGHPEHAGALLLRTNFDSPVPYVPLQKEVKAVAGFAFNNVTYHEKTFINFVKTDDPTLSEEAARQKASTLSPEQKAKLIQKTYETLATDQNNDPGYCYVAPEHDVVNEALALIVESYNKSITTCTTNQARLETIAKHTQHFERLHPFDDANGRTFVNCLLNWMLLREGFPPATFKDPNVFDLFSVAEITEKIKTAINDSQQLIKNPNRALHGFKHHSLPKKDLHLLSKGNQHIAKAIVQTENQFKQNHFREQLHRLKTKYRPRFATLVNNAEDTDLLHYALEKLDALTEKKQVKENQAYEKSPLIHRLIEKCKTHPEQAHKLQNKITDRLQELSPRKTLK